MTLPVALVFVMLAALPIIIVLLNTLQRRYPNGFVARYPAWLRGALGVVYVLAGIDAYAQASRVRGGLFMASGIALLALAGAEWWFRRLEKPEAVIA